MEIRDTAKYKILLNHIYDSGRTVVIHVILTKLFEPNGASLGYFYNYSKAYSIIISIKYTFTNLNWIEYVAPYRKVMDAVELRRIKSYWLSPSPLQWQATL
jgi:hypothetical protein